MWASPSPIAFSGLRMAILPFLGSEWHWHDVMKRSLVGNEAKNWRPVLILVLHTVYRQIKTSHLTLKPDTFDTTSTQQKLCEIIFGQICDWLQAKILQCCIKPRQIEWSNGTTSSMLNHFDVLYQFSGRSEQALWDSSNSCDWKSFRLKVFSFQILLLPAAQGLWIPDTTAHFHFQDLQTK